jgi:hypothetical protein
MARASNGFVPLVHQNDSKSFYGIFLVSFVVFFAFALLAGLATGHWRSTQ